MRRATGGRTFFQGVPGLYYDMLDLEAEAAHGLTQHAAERMPRRGIRLAAIAAALRYGRVVYTRGAYIYGIGRKEVDCCRQQGVDLSSYVGVQIVCSPDGSILTAYRNRNFRGLRPERRRRHSRRSGLRWAA